MDRRSQIVRLIDLAAPRIGWTPATVSWRASGSGATYARLARGHDITTRRADRIVQWLSDHWPPGAEWPADIPRPPPTPAPSAEPAASLKPGNQRPREGAHAEPSAGSAEGAGAPDPLAATRAAMERHVDLLGADPVDWDAAEAAEAEKFAAALTLGAGGRVASPEAVCLALGISRDVYQDVVRRYADAARNRGRPRRGSQADRMLTALVVAGDVRFAARDRSARHRRAAA